MIRTRDGVDPFPGVRSFCDRLQRDTVHRARINLSGRTEIIVTVCMAQVASGDEIWGRLNTCSQYSYFHINHHHRVAQRFANQQARTLNNSAILALQLRHLGLVDFSPLQ